MDSDYFRFTTGSGSVSINIVGAERGPNVDIQADLLDETGNIIASSNPTSLLTASFSLNLNGGNYYLRISGSGMGDLTTGYSNYGSLGGYVITGTVVDPSGTVPPVAVASASPATGNAPLNVQFSSSGSSDPDGSIVAYAWDFGDGATSTAANPTHLFNVAGNYTVALMVMDNSGLTGSTTINVSVMQPNLGPTAIASASPGSGYAPLSVTLNGANSYDTDGTIVSYQWNFGDGTTGSGATVSHVYQYVGNYTATLTVTDDRGATSSASTAIQSQQDPSKVMSVASISLSSVAVKGGNRVEATVRIIDPANQPVAGAVVFGQFSGAVNGTSSGTTDASGNVVLTSNKLKSGTVEFLVTDLVQSGFLYDPDANALSSALITVGGGGSTGGGGGKGGGGKGGSGKGGRTK